MKKLMFVVITVWMTVVSFQPVAAASAFFDDYRTSSVEEYAYLTGRIYGAGADRKLTELSYSFEEELVIPGMPYTRDEDLLTGKITELDVCPQGICFAGDYLLISAYSSDKGLPGCLYLFDRETDEYLATLGLKATSHMGGIAFDGENLWVCHSDDNTLQRIPYYYLDTVGRCAVKTMVDISETGDFYPVTNTPSCVTYEGGHLYVATTTVFFDSVMKSYTYEHGVLNEENSYGIPARVQGIAFAPDGRVLLSTSYGRRNSSYLKVYPNLMDLSNAPTQPSLSVELPPCSEELTVEGDLCILFESAAYRYITGSDGLGKSESPIDTVLRINLDSIG